MGRFCSYGFPMFRAYSALATQMATSRSAALGEGHVLGVWDRLLPEQHLQVQRHLGDTQRLGVMGLSAAATRFSAVTCSGKAGHRQNVSMYFVHVQLCRVQNDSTSMLRRVVAGTWSLVSPPRPATTRTCDGYSCRVLETGWSCSHVSLGSPSSSRIVFFFVF